MKKANVFLAGSLVLNAGLIAFLTMPSATAPAPDTPERAAVPISEEPSRSVSLEADEPAPPPRGAGADTASGVTATPAERTRSMHAVRQLVAELRRRGVDEGTVRRLGVAHAERRFRLEARALFSPTEKLDYWRAPADGRFGQFEPAKLREFQRLRRERVETLEELFGPVETEATEHNSVNHYLYDAGALGYEYAPLEKRLALTEYFERETIGAGRTPVQRLLSSAHAGSAARELEHADKVRRILGPDLFDEYLLQSSGVSSRLKYELAALHPTRAEFDQLVRAEYRLLREQSETLENLRRTPRGQSEDSDIKKLDEARSEAFRDVLGEGRYADFERATDDAYRHIEMTARELGLGPSAARAAFAHVERARKQVFALSPEGANLADPRIMNAMRKIRDETQDRIAEELGLQSLDDNEQQMMLGPALSIHPRQLSQRIFRWF
jgi:hypothetical protein